MTPHLNRLDEMVQMRDHNINFYAELPYFFGYKTGFYSFLDSRKNLDPSYKMDLDLCDYLGRVKLVFYQSFIELIESFVVILERGKARLIAE